jgi:hypothetical protein
VIAACACAAALVIAARAAAQSEDAQPLPLQPPPAQPEPPLPVAPVQPPPPAQPAQPPPPQQPAPPAPAPTPQPAPPSDVAPPADTDAQTGGQQGPIIELPPEPSASDSTRTAQEAPTAAAVDDAAPESLGGTLIGGYGQFNLTSLKVGPDADFDTRANLRRLVLFVSHAFTPEIAAYAELEWENAIACPSCQGSVEVEQAFVDWKLLGDALVLRTGLLLVPMGIINLWHEPPVFHGVERPATDSRIIPTTWRELGLGVKGTLAEIARYELYLTTTLAPTGLGPTGLAGARTLGSLAPADAFAVTGRFEVEPLLGLTAGASFFASDLGGNGEFFTPSGRPEDISVPLFGYALDARMRRSGIEARVLWAQFFLPNAGDLMQAERADGSPLFPNARRTGPVPSRIEGGYVELAYDVLSLLETDHQLLPFVRLEMYDTQADVPDAYDANPELDIEELTMGLSYRPIAQLVFKSDVQLRDRRLGLDELQINFGVGYMY